MIYHQAQNKTKGELVMNQNTKRIVKIKGGLGNQMFQYAFATYLNKTLHFLVLLDFSYFNNVGSDSIRVPRIKSFNISLPEATPADLASALLLKHNKNIDDFSYKAQLMIEVLLNHHFLCEQGHKNFPDKILAKNAYFEGYWQDYNYVDTVWPYLQKEFKVKNCISEQSLKMVKKVRNENSVFIGVRKGDYSLKGDRYGSFGQDYYDKAVSFIKSRVDNPVFYIFSNDTDWVEKNLDYKKWGATIWRKEDTVNDFEDFLIMANCHHSIIINSTYHWWAARLYEYDGKIVVAPNKWFFDKDNLDIIPPRWVRL
jgi:hypothetical protein